MVEYIKQLAGTIQLAKDNLLKGGGQKIHGNDVPDIHSLFTAFAEELNRLDPRDFEPAVRHEFVMLRVAVRNSANGQIGDSIKAAHVAATMSTTLDSYAGDGSGAVTRDFSFVTDQQMKTIIERDYRELTQKTFPDGSWKSTVILSGSILEAVLYDRLTRDVTARNASMNSPKAPKRKGKAKDITLHDYDNQWSLSDMIKVACDLNLLPFKDERAIHQILREYRNFVHPRLEAEMGIEITEGHATASKGLLDVCLDQIT
ncbi:hypothetical protein LCGC14_2702370 [marine sediment metagenome]|uniref:Uncharacterized protein n=1 Tax=marine sediment metagenome TaxID=412755 RepID=A0A0F8ZFH4_9ZZZZ